MTERLIVAIRVNSRFNKHTHMLSIAHFSAN